MRRQLSSVAGAQDHEPCPPVAPHWRVVGYALREQKTHDPVHVLDPLSNQGLPLPAKPPAIFLLGRRHRHHGADPRLAPLLAYKRGEPRVCAMVAVPSPEEEDRRRLCRERQTLIAERIEHVNRIMGLLFAQGISDYAPVRRDRRARLMVLRTGDGRELPPHLKAQIGRELDRLELLLDQIAAVEREQDALLGASKPAGAKSAPDAVTMLLALSSEEPRVGTEWRLRWAE